MSFINSTTVSRVHAQSNFFNDPGIDPNWVAKLKLDQMAAEVSGMTPKQQVVGVVLDAGIEPHPDLDPVRYKKPDGSSADLDLVGGPIQTHHGSGVASVVGAVWNNNLQVVGTAGSGSVWLISGRILDANLQSPLSRVIAGYQAIGSLIDQGVQVRFVVCAFGANGASQALQDTVTALTAKGVVVFAGMGRWSGTTCDFIPACYSLTNPNVISVGALNGTGDAIDPNVSGASDILAPASAQVVSFLPGSNGASFAGFSAAIGVPAGIFATTLSYRTMDVVEARERVKFAAFAHPTTGAQFGAADAWLAATSKLFLVGSQQNSGAASALDSVNFTAGPFDVQSNYFQIIQPTRVMLFAYNLTLGSGESPTNITVTAQDSQGHTYTFPVEYALPVPNNSFLTQVGVRLPNETAGVGNVSAVVTLHGQTSNPVVISIK